MFFINTKYGFISAFAIGENYEGEKVTKAKHCIDVREALPFATRQEAEQAWKRLDIDWWHCIVCSTEPNKDLEALLLRAADSLQDYCAEVNGDMNDYLAMEIYKKLGK